MIVVMVGWGSGGWVEWAQDENLMTAHQAIGEGVLPLRKLFKDCFERNQVSLYHTHAYKHNCVEHNQCAGCTAHARIHE